MGDDNKDKKAVYENTKDEYEPLKTKSIHSSEEIKSIRPDHLTVTI